MDKALRQLLKPVMEATWPALECPECSEGRLALVDADKDQQYWQTAVNSRLQAQDNEGWFDAPDWRGTFATVLTCGACGQKVSVAGDAFYDQMWDQGPASGGWFLYLVPRYFYPAMKLIDVPSRCPDPVAAEVRSGGALMWFDPGGTITKLRIAIERILDDQGVRKTRDERGRRVRASLHYRIGLLRLSQPGVADLLEAVKWLGNDGSHVGSLKPEEVLEGAALLELALQELYDDSAATARKRAQRINRRRRGRR